MDYRAKEDGDEMARMAGASSITGEQAKCLPALK